jgi:hypothetical protein
VSSLGKVGGCALVALAALVACSSKSSSSTTTSSDAGGENGVGEDGGGVVSCSGQADTYVANLTEQGKLGKYTFTLVSATPAPPDLDGNTWAVTIKDATGASPALDQVQVLPFMPQMGHGSDQTPQLTANADGSFGVSDIYLFMDGLWTVTFTVTEPPAEDAGSKTPATIDQGVFTFCIDG